MFLLQLLQLHCIELISARLRKSLDPDILTSELAVSGIQIDSNDLDSKARFVVLQIK